MSVDVQAVKNDIWRVKQKIKDTEGQLAEWKEQLVQFQKLVEYGAKDTDLDVRTEVENTIAELQDKLKPFYKELEGLQAKLPEEAQPAAPKFDVEKHPVLKKMVEKPDAEPEAPVNFASGDVVEAQWTDKQYYKAKIQTLLGSQSAPKYLIKFLDYDETMTVTRDTLRPIVVKRKREPEPPAQPATPVTSTPQVISGPVSINPEAKKAMGVNPALDVPAPRRHNIPNKKALEKGVNNWKNWNSKGVGKKISQKDSMFRSGTNAGSRVGFTGSGSGMTATQKRMRYNTKADIEAEAAANAAANNANKGTPVKRSSYDNGR